LSRLKVGAKNVINAEDGVEGLASEQAPSPINVKDECCCFDFPRLSFFLEETI